MSFQDSVPMLHGLSGILGKNDNGSSGSQVQTGAVCIQIMFIFCNLKVKETTFLRNTIAECQACGKYSCYCL